MIRGSARLPRNLLNHPLARHPTSLSLVYTSPTPSLRRHLEPSNFSVGMSETQRSSPPGLPDWAVFPAQSGNPSDSALQFTARWILYVDY